MPLAGPALLVTKTNEYLCSRASLELQQKTSANYVMQKKLLGESQKPPARVLLGGGTPPRQDSTKLEEEPSATMKPVSTARVPILLAGYILNAAWGAPPSKQSIEAGLLYACKLGVELERRPCDVMVPLVQAGY
jgi:hypothetical protein